MVMKTDQRLIIANVLLTATVLAHGLDHTLQERGIDALTTEVRIGGFANAVLAGLALVLALRRSQRALVTSAVAGVWIFLGVGSAHFAPHWSALSDPYSGLSLGALSWVAAGAEAAAAAGLAVVAIGALRERQRQLATGTL
jgi:hypothetical protein